MLKLHANERMIGTYRKIWIAFAKTVVVAVFLAAAPFLLIPLPSLLPAAIPIRVLSGELLGLAAILWWWAVWTGSFLAFANYYLDVFIVTNERVIHIEQLGLFRRRIAELRLERVQDVTIEQLGVLPTLFHFGTVRVQTAGEAGAFVFSSIPRPIQVKEMIMAAQRNAMRLPASSLSPAEPPLA